MENRVMNANAAKKKIVWVTVRLIQENQIPVEAPADWPYSLAAAAAIKKIKDRTPDTRLGTNAR